eukprot:XP_765970.1 hypothetical protein [Theileria parva strain Muguga]
MIGRFHIATKNINLLSSLQDSVTCINKVHLSKLLNLHENNVINPSDYRNLIYYLSQAPDKLRLNEVNTLVKGMLYTKYKPDSYFFDKIMSNLGRNYQENPLLSVDTFYYLLLLNHEDVSPDECVEFLDNFRISADLYVQLKLLNVFYAIQFYHSHIQESYTPEIENFVKYLRLISPKLKLKCGIKEESKEIKQVKSTMDSLNLEYFSAITGINTLNPRIPYQQYNLNFMSRPNLPRIHRG